MEKTKLRVGLLLDDFNMSVWSVKMIENIINSNFAEITLVVMNDNEVKQASNKTLFSKIINNRGRIWHLVVRKTLEKVYAKLIERNIDLPDVDQQTNCENLLKDCTVIKTKTKRKKWSDYFYDDDIKTINQFNIDIFVRCGFGILRGDILNSAKYGVWSFHHGDNFANRGGPAGFWESMESWPETGSILQILTEDLDNGKVLYRSYSCTDKMSVKDNRSNYYWKSLSFMERKMRELYDMGEKDFFEKVADDNKHPTFYSERLYTDPTNRELAKLTFNKIIEKTKLLYTNRFFLDQWILMFHLKSEFSSSLWRYKKIIPPKDRFWADPHVIYRDNKYYIFIEEYFYSTQKGHISLITMDENGVYSEPEIILDTPYHLSYPFVFEHENDLYMIPESIENKTIELYKCVEFPNKWEFQLNLMEDIVALDTTIVFHNNKYWLFANLIENDGASSWDELFLFYADDLFSNDWKPHPQNPIVSDCKSARPAGKIFYENGSLYRPSQNCSHRYGYGFNICEITELNENNYAEEIVSRVKPNWDKQIVGTHTFNRVNSLHIIDAIYRRRR
jgi:hypothetical protein